MQLRWKAGHKDLLGYGQVNDGQIIDVNEEMAANLISEGSAEAVEAPAKRSRRSTESAEETEETPPEGED